MSKILSIRSLTQIALLSTLCYIGRIIFSGIPNVQPITTLLFIFTVSIGWQKSIIIAGLTMLVSNLYLGMGPWTLMQIATYMLLVIASLPIIRFSQYFNPIIQQMISAVWCGLLGYLYGFIISIIWVKLYGIANFWSYYLRGIPFDTAHAVGNFIFYLLLAPIVTRILQRYMIRRP
ncbi:ECF transporter S component [Tuanshanicoccus lijuaniae]|uniref:ECF transporter S component n=1 Tax=Aerococcaceae bacterium zg-1292 TaxID=2774330 RepID=UPI001934C1AE|nr:ECF transporter S component [Aerococcaceae bacterium zg-1292]QQA37210.1 ECF transporter S component [Aerococcaceae bacterium zg-1292]